MLDEYCTACHDGRPRADGQTINDLRGDRQISDYTSVYHHGGRDAGRFSVSYAELHRYVRRPGLESDYHLLTPMEFHADTTQLVQMLASTRAVILAHTSRAAQATRMQRPTAGGNSRC